MGLRGHENRRSLLPVEAHDAYETLETLTNGMRFFLRCPKP